MILHDHRLKPVAAQDQIYILGFLLPPFHLSCFSDFRSVLLLSYLVLIAPLRCCRLRFSPVIALFLVQPHL